MAECLNPSNMCILSEKIRENPTTAMFSVLFMHSCITGSTIYPYIAHFLSEINETEVAGKQQTYESL